VVDCTRIYAVTTTQLSPAGAATDWSVLSIFDDDRERRRPTPKLVIDAAPSGKRPPGAGFGDCYEVALMHDHKLLHELAQQITRSSLDIALEVWRPLGDGMWTVATMPRLIAVTARHDGLQYVLGGLAVPNPGFEDITGRQTGDSCWSLVATEIAPHPAPHAT